MKLSSSRLFGFAASLMLLFPLSVQAANDTHIYPIEPREVAEGLFMVEGAREPFTRSNGGAIANVAFVIEGDRVILLDTGPSKRYGEQLRAVIEQRAGKTPTDVIVTHHHPDHSLGTQAFMDAKVYALASTKQALALEGPSFAESMYTLVGDWMRGTELVLPNEILVPGPLFPDTDRFEVLSFTGHSGADLVLLDHQTRTLLASDIIFYNRALATPHTPTIQTWLDDLSALEQLPFEQIIPGHGPLIDKASALEQMRDYLTWLDQILTESAQQGLTANEVAATPIPERFAPIAMTRYELARTVIHLYPSYESDVFSAQ